jgi:phage major head subunit gpT-like protein
MSGALGGLSFRNIKGNYFASLEERMTASWVPLLASMIDTDQPYELYKFLGNVPTMTKWDGERKRRQLKDLGFQVITDKFEATIEVDIDDYRRDKTGQILTRIQELGVQAAILPQQLITTLIESGGNGYDGAAFFADSHNNGTFDNNYNAVAWTNPDIPTSAEMAAAILGAIQAQYAALDERGQPVNEFASRFLVMVPVKYWSAVKAALQNDFTSTGVSNTLLNAGVQIDSVVNPRLTGTAAAAGRRFYVFRTDAPVKPFIWQEENISDAFKTLDANSDNGFWKDTLAFGAKRMGNAGFGRFEYATRVQAS